MHPVFNSTANDWMYLDESPSGGSTSSSASRPQPEIPLDETPPDVPVILMNPDDAEIDAIDAQPPKVERRMRKKSVDPVTAAALEKVQDKLRDKKELYKLHLKHYHIKLDAFKKRTSQLQLPKDIYDLYEQVVKECETCSKLTDAPVRSKVSGMRAEVFGDLTFIDYAAVKNPATSA